MTNKQQLIEMIERFNDAPAEELAIRLEAWFASRQLKSYPTIKPIIVKENDWMFSPDKVSEQAKWLIYKINELVERLNDLNEQ